MAAAGTLKPQQIEDDDAERTGSGGASSKRGRHPSLPDWEDDLTLEAIAVRVQILEREIGDVPRHAKREQGSGIWGIVHELNESFKGLDNRLSAFIAAVENRERAAEAAAAAAALQRDKRLQPISRIAEKVTTVVITFLVTALLAAVGAHLARLEYRPKGSTEPERPAQYAYQLSYDLAFCSCGPSEILPQSLHLLTQGAHLEDAPEQQ